MKLTTLALTPEEAKEQNGDACCEPTSNTGDGGPKYPWGTSIYLSDTALKKMGITELPAVGSKMVMVAEVTIVSVSKREDQNGSDQTLDMQMTAVGLEPKVEAAATRMYPNSLMMQ